MPDNRTRRLANQRHFAADLTSSTLTTFIPIGIDTTITLTPGRITIATADNITTITRTATTYSTPNPVTVPTATPLERRLIALARVPNAKRRNIDFGLLKHIADIEGEWPAESLYWWLKLWIAYWFSGLVIVGPTFAGMLLWAFLLVVYLSFYLLVTLIRLMVMELRQNA
ncbi:hypothetical protein K461DRAFT_275873 [Myriangium duriaei CBS 260.36]|uniref:Uncharacterized protein n=1 Tax=Myriangium duriaei CBS 260.36 TaxID=1168546 RepID=A0A9P4J505_9PEZI|nr:hypothetical protein K461DRAFT_275873 [Myriangium duriaei CBS 260.36]